MGAAAAAPPAAPAGPVTVADALDAAAEAAEKCEDEGVRRVLKDRELVQLLGDPRMKVTARACGWRGEARGRARRHR